MFRTWHLQGGVSCCLLGWQAVWKSPRESRAHLWHPHRCHRQPQAGQTGRGRAGHSPKAAAQPGGESRRARKALKAVLPGQSLRQHFPVRDLGPGEAGFLLRHCDVTARVGTGPRKTSSCTGPTLVQDTGSELSAVP